MPKFFILTLFVLLMPIMIFAQEVKKEAVPELDSAAILKDLMNLMGIDNKPTSYVNVELSVGNRLFSMHNNRLNTKQASTKVTVYNPSVTYYHKKGANIGVGTSLLNDTATSFGPTQYSLSAGYDLPENDKFNFSFSYTHYFIKDQYSAFASPILNDFYTSLEYKKAWLQPAIAFGYSTGNYKQVIKKDTTIGANRRLLYDSSISTIKYFSMIAAVSHSFKWYTLFNKEDELDFKPTLLLNMGTSTTSITHKTNAIYLFRLLNKKGKLPKVQTSAFQAESVGLNLDFSYALGRFTLQPQCYLDYYLPKSDFDKFSQFFTFTLGYAF
jgi:hypothetical protein